MNKLMKNLGILFLLLILNIGVFAQVDKPIYQGQPPAEEVDTTTKPIEKQKRQIFAFVEDGVYFTNDFDGARLNEIERTGENSYTILITPENFPINMSPWYAFKVWSKKKKEINVRLKYPEFAKHRYSPLISKNGLKWKPLESARITEEEKEDESKATARPKRIVMRLKVGKKPTWVSAQELQTSKHVFVWMDNLAKKRKFEIEEIGKSKEGKPLRLLKIGNLESKKMIMIISRQHPPEVTGYFAMQAFVEKIADDSKLSEQFRESFGIYVVPLMNPDGVDAGHWRYNAGGIDLNRDWTKFNQPEGLAVSEFLQKRERETGGKFYFGIDFHSTWDDIYYPMDRNETNSNMPNLVYDWMENIGKAIPNYEMNIKPNERPKPAIVSRNYFYFSHKMEAIVFEIGDNTPREFIRKKGEVGAIELMKLMLARQDVKAKSASAKSF
ncbi:MAG: M14 family metallopeptidase [Acidobacteriota bacterium]|nr:M14 family metallopeptidase [Acidobacteriota bacterium]